MSCTLYVPINKSHNKWEEATNPNKTKHFPFCLTFTIYKTIFLIIKKCLSRFYLLYSFLRKFLLFGYQEYSYINTNILPVQIHISRRLFLLERIPGMLFFLLTKIRNGNFKVFMMNLVQTKNIIQKFF